MMELNDRNFDEEILRAKIPALVEFWGSWCPPSQRMKPVLKKLERVYDGKVKVGQLNVDKYPSITARYKIAVCPTFIIFRDGETVVRDIGAKSERQLREMIESASKS